MRATYIPASRPKYAYSDTYLRSVQEVALLDELRISEGLPSESEQRLRDAEADQKLNKEISVKLYGY